MSDQSCPHTIAIHDFQEVVKQLFDKLQSLKYQPVENAIQNLIEIKALQDWIEDYKNNYNFQLKITCEASNGYCLETKI